MRNPMNAPTEKLQEIQDRLEIAKIKEWQIRGRTNALRRELGKASRARHKISKEWNAALMEHNRSLPSTP